MFWKDAEEFKKVPASQVSKTVISKNEQNSRQVQVLKDMYAVLVFKYKTQIHVHSTSI